MAHRRNRVLFRAPLAAILCVGLYAGPSSGAQSASVPSGASPAAGSRVRTPVARTTCGDAQGSASITASDALFALKSAVGSETCALCLCDANGSGTITASDALRILKKAVGEELDLLCEACANAAPTVEAGAPQTIALDTLSGAAIATLLATVNDDGLPNPPSALTLSWTLLSGPTPQAGADFANASSASTTVTLAETGLFVLQLEAGDGAASITDTVEITVVAATNLAPSLLPIDDASIALGTTLSVRATADDDNPNDALVYSLIDAPAGATLDPPSSGRILWTPTTQDEVGNHEFTIRVEDQDGLFDQRSFTVSVTTANQPPALAPLTNETIRAGTEYQRVLAASDADVSDTHAYEILDAPAQMNLGGVSADTLLWATTDADIGVHAIKLRVVDSGSPTLDDVAMFLLTVAANTAPVAADDSYEVGEGETLLVQAPGILGNDVDPDADALAAMKLSNPDLGTVTAFHADGSFEYQAPAEAPDPVLAIAEKWRGGGEPTHPYALPLIGDVNEDGYPDVVMSVLNNEHVALSGLDGSVIWNATHNDPGGLDLSDCYDWLAASNARVLADVDDDGSLEYVVPSACSRDGGNGATVDRVLAYDNEGKPKWISPRISRPHPDARPPGGGAEPPDPLLYTAFSLYGMNPSVARLSPETTPTLLVRAKITPSEGWYTQPDGTGKAAGCRALTGRAEDEGLACRATILLSGIDGSVQEVLTAPNPGNLLENPSRYPWRENSPFAADLEGNGSVEIISGSDVWKKVGGEWTLAWQTTQEPAEVAVADLDGDGVMEVIHLSNQGADDGYIIYRHDGTELRRLPVSPSYYPGYFTVADVDGDGSPDFIDSSMGYVQALRSDGRVLWVFALPPVPEVASTPATRSGSANVQAYDLDGDGISEVIVSGVDGVHILDGRSGTEKVSYLQPNDAGYGFTAASFVADVDNDGHADVVTVSYRGGTNCAATPPDCNIAAVIEGAANDWLPGPKIFHQTQFRLGDVDDSGHVLFNSTVQRSFRNPQQLGTPADPRAARGTSFTYAATDGAADSNAASVFLEITPANRPPVITSLPPSAFLSIAPYTRPGYQITAIDPDPGDTVTYELVVNQHPFADAYEGIQLDASSGEMRVYTGPCGSYGGPCEFDNFLVVLAAVDSHGARTEQSFTLAVSSTGIAVPDAVGEMFEGALQTLAGVNLRGKLLEEAYSVQPAGTVIAQDTAPSTVVARGSTVLLTVSRGPRPVVVPDVVGLPEATAKEKLEALGFTVEVVRAYSTMIPRSDVSTQSPAAGDTIAPANAQITVSLGTGIVVRLGRDYATANQTIDVSVFTVDTSNEETPLAGANLAVEAAGDLHLGATPNVSGHTIAPADDTRGTWRVTATDPDTTRSGSAEFTVVQAADADTNIDVAAFAEFSETLTGVLGLLREAAAAGAAGDSATLQARAEQAVLLWRSFDQEVLRLSSPFAPEDGLPPRKSDMNSFGVFETAEDALHVQVLEGTVTAVDALVEGLRDESTLLPEVAARLTDVVTATAPLGDTNPTEYGFVAAQPEYAVLAAHLLPDWVDALMNDLGTTMDMTPVPPTELTAAPPGEEPFAATRTPRAAQGTASAAASHPRPRSTIGEQLTVFAVNTVIEQLNTLKKLHNDVMKQAFSGVMLVGLASHLRAALTTSELVEVVAGASLSFRRFYAPYTMVEGFGFDEKYPQLNEVILLGPDTVAPGIDLFEAIKGAKFDTLWSSIKTLKDGHDKIKDFLGGADEAYANGVQRTHFAERPCIFTTAPGCVQLLFPNGFYSVYSYEPPPGFGTLVGIPLPIITLVRSSLTGEYSFATPPFIPFKPGQDQ